MITTLDCLPCILRQALEAARNTTDDETIHQLLLHEVLHELGSLAPTLSPPAVGQRIHRRLRELTGVEDPYREAKKRFNRMAMELLPAARDRIEGAADPFGMALRLAFAGNVIDLGPTGDLTEAEARRAMEQAADQPLYGDVTGLQSAIKKSKHILYLADNAGEILFDHLFIEHLPRERLTLAVRGRPVLNDATLEDARMAGLDERVEVIDNGSDAPATLLEDCSPRFRERFEAADLVIAKGQGNFESLSTAPGDISFLFRAKCRAVAEIVGRPRGSHMVLRSGELQGAMAGRL